MEKKITGWKTKGMNRDLSVSAFNPEFSFENINLRLSTNDNNTLMSWVNEKGTLEIKDEENSSLTLEGIAVGTAVLNNQLVVFTTGSTTTANEPDHIYVLTYYDAAKTKMQIVHSYAGNLNLSTDYPLETLVSYETDKIQKVYWTDGLNQPRVINIAADGGQWNDWNSTEDGSVDTFFDFVPAAGLKESVEIEKEISSGGTFAPGVIQYCFTYVNKNAQQSNVIYVSPLYYLAHSDRGASPEEKVSNVFTIKMKGVDKTFDYIRLYSIQRTSLNLEPVVKLLDDISTSQVDNADMTIVYTDNGTSGLLVDPTELLFVGGKVISALTMADKDGTLFLGNITQADTRATAIQEYIDSLRGELGEGEHLVEFDRDDLHSADVDYSNVKTYTLDHTTGIYHNTNTLNKNNREISTFKGGQTYRFGFQLQTVTGEWTEPVYLDDVKNDKYPYTNTYSDKVKLAYAKAQVDLSDITGTDLSGYKRIRPVVVLPNISDREVICQGVLNPTVFNAMDRIDNSPFAQSSWYFRPYMVTKSKEVDDGSQYTTSNYIKVSSEPINEEPVIAPPQGFENAVHPVYVLVADILEDSIDRILQYGLLYFGESDGSDSDFHSEYFLGAIMLGENIVASDTYRYAFFFENYRPVNFVRGAYNDGRSCFMEDEPFMIYDGMEYTSRHLFYYEGDIDYQFQFYIFDPDVEDPETHIIKHGYGQIEYTVKFIKTETSSRDSEYVPTSGDDSGDEIKYCHYDSLVTDKEVGSKELSRQVEIQGSINIYETPFSTERKSGVKKSNTQFFIDQSIVTLHSPDLEFDTEVQTYGVEGLKMRVIGAIPITANISAHKIETSSNMLENNHNVNSSSADTKYYFGSGELNYNALHKNIDLKAGNRLVSEYLWNDVAIERYTTTDENSDGVKSHGYFDFLVYPWQRKASLNNDFRTADKASSMLWTKKESNLLYSINTEYFEPHGIEDGDGGGSREKFNYENISTKIFLTENAEIFTIKLPQQSAKSSEITYYPNIDKVLYNENGYKIKASSYPTSYSFEDVSNPVPMKYKSTTHAILSFNAISEGVSDENGRVPLLPFGVEDMGLDTQTNYGFYQQPDSRNTFWGDEIEFTQYHKSVILNNLFKFGDTHKKHNFLWIGELYKEPVNQFGGTSESALRNNKWLVGGDTQDLDLINGNTLYWTEGDTYYQRYDCLKTYCFTEDDANQLVEILSFMCETHTNIDGRYDRNRGQADNTNMHPKIFNILNPVYSQQDNFFTSKKMYDKDESLHYPNLIYYTKTKTSGADVDLWTNVTLASTLELDGDKGEITSLDRLNDQIIAFQDTGISQILYNENVQIATTQGVPIEIANSGKVQGKRYISNTIGCSNKWAMATSPMGIYFMDSNDKGIYLFNGQLNNLSASLGFNSWAKQNIPAPEVKWTPDDFDNFIAHYDKQNQDVLFINKDTALAYSEKVAAFTSFYDYGDTPYFCNVNDTGVWINKNAGTSKLWKQNAGDYCKFFGVNKPYSITLVGNAEPQRDKIFTDLEFRASVDGDGINMNDELFNFYLPFDNLEVWDEYQHGIATLQAKNGISGRLHHMDNTASLKRKFRIWRCDIPRDNYPINQRRDIELNISRTKVRPLDRMRNPWMYLKLQKDAALPIIGTHRTEIHDMLLGYYV